MSLREHQNFLARLYTDPDLRRSFFEDPAGVARETGLDETEAATLAAISTAELDGFANSLVWKRLREAEKLLPHLVQVMGEEFRGVFFDFASTFNPQGTKKHLDDAVELCRSIEKAKELDVQFRAAARFDRKRLGFVNSDRFAAVCLSLRNVPGIPLVAIWIRKAGRVHYFSV